MNIPSTPEDRLIDFKETAHLLGDVSERSVRRLISRGDLPQPVKVLSAPHLYRSEVFAYAQCSEGAEQWKPSLRAARLYRPEIQRLLAVAWPRKAIYLTAVFTGLRRGELAALEWGDVHLNNPNPFLNVRASTTKNHRQAVIPLHRDVVTELESCKLNVLR